MRGSLEFYPQRQRKPVGVATVDFETRQPSLYHTFNALWREYMELKDLMDKLLNEQIDLLQKQLAEAQEIKLHLASISDAEVEDSNDS